MVSYSCHSKSASVEGKFPSSEIHVIKIGPFNPFICVPEISF